MQRIRVLNTACDACDTCRDVRATDVTNEYWFPNAMGSRVGREIDVDRVRASHDDGRRTTDDDGNE